MKSIDLVCLYGILLDLGLWHSTLIKIWHYLVEKLADLSSTQWAAVSDFASSDLSGDFAKSGCFSKSKFWGGSRCWLVEKSQDDIIFRFWLSSGSQIANETLVASSWFSSGNWDKSQVGFFISGSL
jgi:hypothetical protein